MKKVKLIGMMLGLLIMGFLVSQADAAKLYGRCPYGGDWEKLPEWYYSIAYEVYNNAAGISTTAAELRIDITADLRAATETQPADTVNIKLYGAKFNQPAEWTFVLVDADDNIIGELQPGSTLDNLGFTITQNVSAPASIYLAMVDSEGNIIQYGAGLNVDPGLNPTCSYFPEVKVSFTAPNESVGPVTFAKIYPACPISVSAAEMLPLTAELNADVDFKEFLGGPKVVDELTIYTCGTPCAGGTCEACYKCKKGGNGEPGGQECVNWIAGDMIAFYCEGEAYTFSLSFDLVSESPEPGVDVELNDQKCLEKVSDKVWSCSADNTTKPCLKVTLDGKTENNPTVWTIQNLSVKDLDFGGIPVQNSCLTVAGGDVGAWYGGLEAIVPFVKKSDVANTYIKLFNRYDKDAKLFAEVFNQSSGKIIVALKQIPGKEYIPAGGSIEITADDLMNLCPECDWNFGQAVKFLVRVPSQTGCLNVYHLENNNLNFTACYNNPYDPYIQGIVVSIMNGEQRSVPLLFKYFKQGAYNQ